MDNELNLIIKAQGGDVIAFEELIESYQKTIFSIAYRIAGNPDDAADMTQEVLVKFFKNLNKFKGNSKFSTWLYRVATNTCLDERKRTIRHMNYSLDQEIETDEGAFAGELADTSPTPEESAERHAIKGAINLAISKLKDEHKKVIILRDIQGFSYDEIAKIMHCSTGTVKSRINRARLQLKKILSENMELFENYFVQ